jgi:hypothetical protein
VTKQTLHKKVENLLRDPPDTYNEWVDQITDVVLEEAARTRPKPVDEEAHHLKATDYTAGWNAAVRAYAAAIKTLK